MIVSPETSTLPAATMQLAMDVAEVDEPGVTSTCQVLPRLSATLAIWQPLAPRAATVTRFPAVVVAAVTVMTCVRAVAEMPVPTTWTKLTGNGTTPLLTSRGLSD